MYEKRRDFISRPSIKMLKKKLQVPIFIIISYDIIIEKSH